MDRLEGKQRVHFCPCCAAITQSENKASFFMQRCTMVNMRKACLGGMQVSNQFQNRSPVTTDVYLIYIFSVLPDVYAPGVKFSPVPFDWHEGVRRHEGLPLHSGTFPLNCSIPSPLKLHWYVMYTKRSEGAELLWRSDLGSHTPAAEPQVVKAPYSCWCTKQPQVSGAGVVLRAGISFLQEASGQALPCASLEEQQSEVDLQAFESPFCRRHCKMPRSCGLPVPCHICAQDSQHQPDVTMVARWWEDHQGAASHRHFSAKPIKMMATRL